jgi:hypothetical protein
MIKKLCLELIPVRCSDLVHMSYAFMLEVYLWTGYERHSKFSKTKILHFMHLKVRLEYSSDANSDILQTLYLGVHVKYSKHASS